MKKRFNLFFVLCCSILYIASFAIILLLMQEKPPFFALLLTLTYLPNIAAMIFTSLYKSNQERNDVILAGPLFYVFIAGNIVTFLTMAVLLILLASGIFTSLNILLSIYIIEIVFYLISFIYVAYGVNYMKENLHKTHQKVTFIRQLKITVDSYASACSDVTVTENLKKLSETIRFSDPMSHDSLSDIENDIHMNVNKLGEAITVNDSATAMILMNQIILQLNLRNQQCLALK